jgi:hypothetical protein
VTTLPPPAEMIPVVIDADARDDDAWFDRHPGRRYRLRLGWVIRRSRGGIFLRTPLATRHRSGDDEATAERAWWTAAYPAISPQARAAMTRAARKAAQPSPHGPIGARRSKRRAPTARAPP